MSIKHDIGALGRNEWTTRDGRRLRWADMDADHLRNTSAMLRRNGLDLLSKAFVLLSLVQGDCATDAAENEISSAEAQAERMYAVASDMVRYVDWRETRA